MPPYLRGRKPIDRLKNWRVRNRNKILRAGMKVVENQAENDVMNEELNRPKLWSYRIGKGLKLIPWRVARPSSEYWETLERKVKDRYYKQIEELSTTATVGELKRLAKRHKHIDLEKSALGKDTVRQIVAKMVEREARAKELLAERKRKKSGVSTAPKN
jgi:hypothetical protein